MKYFFKTLLLTGLILGCINIGISSDTSSTVADTEIIVPIHIGGFDFAFNNFDVEYYSILQHFTDEVPNIRHNNSDYLNKMNELKESIIKLNNSFETPQYKRELRNAFACILSHEVSSTAQMQYRNVNQDIEHRLAYFALEYFNLLKRNNNISEEQLQKMCKEFQHIVNNKYDNEFEARYEKHQEKMQKYINRQLPAIKQIQKQYRRNLHQ